MVFPVVFLMGSGLFFNTESEIYTVKKTENDITFTFEQDLKNENIYLELEKIYEEATCESYLQIETYGKKIFAEETLDKIRELGELAMDGRGQLGHVLGTRGGGLISFCFRRHPGSRIPYSMNRLFTLRC